MPADLRSLRFWLLAMDVTRAVFGFGSRPYSWCLRKASDATDWGPALPPDEEDEESEVPF